MNSNPTNGESTAVAATNGDPLIDEVRAIRKELGDRFGNDVEKLADCVRQVGGESVPDKASEHLTQLPEVADAMRPLPPRVVQCMAVAIMTPDRRPAVRHRRGAAGPIRAAARK